MTKKHPMKIGKMTTIDMATGEVTGVKQNAMTMLGPPPDKCQECACSHAWDEPHNQQSLYYQMQFRAKHGRWPTWSDAMAHCAPEVQARWREQLLQLLREKGLEVPPDLLAPKGNGR